MLTNAHALSNCTDKCYVFLQTFKVSMKGSNGLRMVRALISTGFQRTYVVGSAVKRSVFFWWQRNSRKSQL